MTGFDDQTKGYRVFDPNRRLFFKSLDVTFINEGKFYKTLYNNNNLVTIELDYVGNCQKRPVGGGR